MGKAYPPGPRNAAEYVVTTADKIVQYLKRNYLWILSFGLACCAIEMMHAAAAYVFIKFAFQLISFEMFFFVVCFLFLFVCGAN